MGVDDYRDRTGNSGSSDEYIDEAILVKTRRFRSELDGALEDAGHKGQDRESIRRAYESRSKYSSAASHTSEETETRKTTDKPSARSSSPGRKSGGMGSVFSGIQGGKFFRHSRSGKKKTQSRGQGSQGQNKPDEKPGYFDTDELMFRREDQYTEQPKAQKPVMQKTGKGKRKHMASQKKPVTKTKKQGRAGRIIAQLLVCLLLVGAFTMSAAGGALAAFYTASTNTIHTDTKHALRNANVVDASLVYDQDVVNILLIGCDKRQDETEAGRSDTTMIATIDIKNGKLKLTSLMRDMYIDIPGYGYHKFNAAYSYGGVQLEYETIAQNFGIRLDGYVEVDMEAFREVVDLLGGVPMELTEAEAYFLQTAYVNSKHGEKDVKAGPNMMTPYQALAYCRIRQDVMGEFGRTDRQRKVLISIYDELKKEDIMTITNICMRALRHVTTDLTEDQIRSLLTSVISMGTTEIEQLRIPYEGSYTAGRLGAGGAWVMQTDYEANSAALQYFIFGVGEDPGIEDEYGVGNDKFINGYYPEKTEGISTY